jgi:hypothetical protein
VKAGEALKRAAHFSLSLACDVAVPLSPLEAEHWVTGDVDVVSWFATGVTYVAAIGLVSRSAAILILSLLAAVGLAFVYGVDMESIFAAHHAQPPVDLPHLDPLLAVRAIDAASAIYCVERVLLHLIDDKPSLEL